MVDPPAGPPVGRAGQVRVDPGTPPRLVGDEHAVRVGGRQIPGVVFPAELVLAWAAQVLVRMAESQRVQELVADRTPPIGGPDVLEALQVHAALTRPSA